MRVCYHMQELLSDYDGFLVDLWGVIHDGDSLYDGVVSCLDYVHRQGKKIVFLSNAPRRRCVVQRGLDEFGVDRKFYQGLVTSGEITRQHMLAQQAAFGPRYFKMGHSLDGDLLEGADYYQSVSDIDEADWVLAIGFDDEFQQLNDKMSLLVAMKQAGLPMVCANPDLVVVKKTGESVCCAGLLAEAYEKIGGRVTYIGKPYDGVYRVARALMHDVSLSRLAVIGDSITTDIAGANNQALDGYLIPGGILAREWSIQHGEMADAKAVSALCQSHGVEPTGLLAGFVLDEKCQ